MIRMTYNEYEDMIDTFKQNHTIETYWPTEKQISMFEEQPEKWLKFACFLLEHNAQPQNADEKLSRKNLMSYINNEIDFHENDPGKLVIKNLKSGRYRQKLEIVITNRKNQPPDEFIYYEGAEEGINEDGDILIKLRENEEVVIEIPELYRYKVYINDDIIQEGKITSGIEEYVFIN